MQIAALTAEAQQRNPRLAELTAAIEKRQEKMTAMEEQINAVKDSTCASFSKQASYKCLATQSLSLLRNFHGEASDAASWMIPPPMLSACVCLMQQTSTLGYSLVLSTHPDLPLDYLYMT